MILVSRITRKHESCPTKGQHRQSHGGQENSGRDRTGSRYSPRYWTGGHRRKGSLFSRETASLRIFENSEGQYDLSLVDIKGSALIVSQFTLYGDTHKGRRPSFSEAARPEIAAPLVDKFAEYLRAQNIPTQTGIFGAHMLVEIQNDGPVTILLEK